MRTRLLLLSCVLSGLACGGLGPSVDPQTAIRPLCDTTSAGLDGDLPIVDAAPSDPGDGVAVVLRADGGVQVDGRPGDDADLSALLAEQLELQRLLRGRDAGGVKLAVERDVPAERVARVVAALESAGQTELTLVAWSGARREAARYPDPAYAAELHEALTHANPAERATLIAARMAQEIKLCPPASNVFQAIAAASPDMRCELFAVGLSEALPSCPLTDGDRVVTLAQVMVEPSGEHPPTTHRMRTAPLLASLAAEPDAPWHRVWGRW